MVDLPAKLKAKLDKLRALKAGKLQSEPYTVFMRTRTFSNNLLDGYQSEPIVQLMTDGAAAPVKAISQRNLGGGFQEEDIVVTLTPAFDGGGYDPSLFNPESDPSTTPEIAFIVKGPHLPAEGVIYKNIGTSVNSFVIKLTLRNTGERP